MLFLAVQLLAAEGAYAGPIKAVLAPLPKPETTQLAPGEIFTPEERLPIENEPPLREHNPRWFYQEDKPTPGNSDKDILLNFQGIFNTGWYPPDVQVAAGPNYVGEVVNSTLSFYDKTGAEVYTNTLYDFFSSLSPSSDFIFDPKIAYDPMGGRWMVLALFMNSNTQESDYYLAVSQTGDPLGSWFFYSLDATRDGNNPSGNWADYPGLGFNDWGIFITSNQFSWGGSWAYAKLRVLDKTAAYNGTLSSWYDFWNISYTSNWKPAQSMSSTGTEFVLRSYWGGSSYLRAWKLTGPASSPTLSSRYDIPVNYYSPPPTASQQGGTTGLDAGDSRIQDVSYINGKIYATLGEENPTVSGYCASRFFRVDTASMTADQDISFGATGYNYIYPRAASNGSCVAMVFTRCGPTEYAGVRYTFKDDGAAGFGPSELIKPGEAYYVRTDSYGRNRWGDYSGAFMDPDGSTLWACGEYASTGNQWGTWIARVDCGSADYPEGPGQEAGVKVPHGLLFSGPVVLWLESEAVYGVYSATGGLIARAQGPGTLRLDLGSGVYFIRAGTGSGRFVVLR